MHEAIRRQFDTLLVQVQALVPDNSPCPGADQFLRPYFMDAAPGDLLHLDAECLADMVLGHLNFGRYRKPGAPLVRVFHPKSADGETSLNQCIVEVVTDNMPFLVDSVCMALNQRGLTIDLTLHPITRVRRDNSGNLIEVLNRESGEQDDTIVESYLHIQASGDSSVEPISEIENSIRSVLSDVAAAVNDWPAMQDKIPVLQREIETGNLPLTANEIDEAKAFLDWLIDDHFTFLGYREYELTQKNGDEVLLIVKGSGLGILREHKDAEESSSFSVLPTETRKRAREPKLLILTKGNSRSTVHLPTYIDYVGVKRFDDQGQVIGEHRVLGLYTSVAYRCDPYTIPVVRRKLEQVTRRSEFESGGHADKALQTILQTYPRDELFQIAPNLLYDTAMEILHLRQRQRVRLFLRRDTYGRFVSCLVFIARDRYDTELRLRFEKILLTTFNGTGLEFKLSLGEPILARIQFIVRGVQGQLADVDETELEKQLAEAARNWSERLSAALLQDNSERQANLLLRRYRNAFPAGYREDFSAADAAQDIAQTEKLTSPEDLGIFSYRPDNDQLNTLRLKLYHLNTPIPLSDVIPILENLALRVDTERPYCIERQDGVTIWIHDFGTRHAGHKPLALRSIRAYFHEALDATWHNHTENDGFNQLVLSAKLSWREAMVLRAVCRYLIQLGVPFSQAYMETTLANNADISMLLIDYFNTRFDPTLTDRNELLQTYADDINARINDVSSLDEDRILRLYFSIAKATLRTNYFQRDSDGQAKSYLTLKLDPEAIDAAPLPRPKFEIFFYSSRVEGVHLRGGKVARGGIRWSDRREDFRTEILGLMKAQQVKNAVIVPVGAKGGFVLKRPPAEPDLLKGEVEQCYRLFIQGLLDVTDNLMDGKPVFPADTVCYDAADPYLVVAADKGTATFSDIANEIALRNEFWLGDAFASGGSAGYDHKKMGITARGAWESVKRHFRELNIDTQTTPFTTIGIGDMSGDVFGNGMLLSSHTRLIAAFNHLHIFIDPDPDPEVSFQERKRLFELPRSGWLDYRQELISEGGGVFSRTAKSIPLSPQIQHLLHIQSDALTPNALIQCILKASVDLFWNGGIGTFVKARHESHADAGDRVNDAIRVNADELRCRVVGEGGNLGFTQRARVAFARHGGLIITDSIDNSAGVDCSDHEVNIKILLTAPGAAGELSLEQRNRLLEDMTEEVAGLVLTHNYGQTQSISIANRQAPQQLEDHVRFIRCLERVGRLDRNLEFLPNDEEIAERLTAGAGLTRPELAILLSYAKISLYESLLESDVPEDSYLSKDLQRYFPKPLRERYHSYMEAHPLRREIVATHITNSVINFVDVTMVPRFHEQHGYSSPDIVRAYVAARDIFDMPHFQRSVEVLDNQVSADVQYAMLLEMRRLIERATLWFLQNRPKPLEIAAAVDGFADGAHQLTARLRSLVTAPNREALDRAAERYVGDKVPAELAERCSGLGALYSALDIVEVAAGSRFDLDEVAGIYFDLGHRLSLYWLRDKLRQLSDGRHWQRLATEGLFLDLYRTQRLLTSRVVAGRAKSKHVDQWISRNKSEISRIEKINIELIENETPNLAMLLVAIREIQALTD